MIRHQKSVVSLLLAAIVVGTGCSNAKEGALSGAGIGALTGLAIGSVTGSAGKGAAIGAVVGGIGGAVVGNENKKKSDREEAMAKEQMQQQKAATAATATTPPPSGSAGAPGATVVTVTTTTNYQTGPALGKLVGNWNISGIVEGADGKPMAVNGTAKAATDKTYFLKIDITTKDPRDGTVIEGTSVISQRGGRALDMTNSFSTSPQVKQFRGEMDESGSVFSFTQYDPPNSSRKVILRAADAKQFTADVWDGSRKLESYTFTSAN